MPAPSSALFPVTSTSFSVRPPGSLFAMPPPWLTVLPPEIVTPSSVTGSGAWKSMTRSPRSWVIVVSPEPSPWIFTEGGGVLCEKRSRSPPFSSSVCAAGGSMSRL
jgi:hypothetical protein